MYELIIGLKRLELWTVGLDTNTSMSIALRPLFSWKLWHDNDY